MSVMVDAPTAILAHMLAVVGRRRVEKHIFRNRRRKSEEELEFTD
jgi:hypothetical protein